MKFNVRYITTGAVIAALYVVLTLLSAAFNLSSGVFQLRLSEMLCIFPCYTVAAVPGLFIGCLLSGILTGAVIWDIIFGSIATLLGAIGTRLIAVKICPKDFTPTIKRHMLTAIPPIISNAVIVPFILIYAYNIGSAYLLILLAILAGETLAVGVLGYFVSRCVSRLRLFK